MEITFLGGANEIGASSTLIEVAGVRLLVDAGLRPKGSGKKDLPNLDLLPDQIDAVLLTHAHIDHLGALPVIHQRFPGRPVLTSEPTAALAKIMLLDSAYLQRIQPGPPLYTKDDVQTTVSLMRPLLMERWYQLTSAVSLCMIPAGHLLGAVTILLDTAEGRIVFSGDVSLTHQRAVPGFAAPPFPADVLILESTYGDSVHPGRSEEERRLVESVTEVIDGGGIALIPSFALGRAQEVMLTLRQAQLVGESPPYPIYADGLVRAVTEVYNKQRRYLTPPLQEAEEHVFWQKRRVTKVKAAQRRQILGRPACIVASSGMLFGGPSVFYASQLLEDPDNAIFITGYTDEESPGRRLQRLASGDKLKLNGETYTVACQVRKFGLSGHADADQLAALVNHFEPRDTFLVHGEGKGRAALKEKLPDHFRIHLPANDETVNFAAPNWMIRKRPYLLDPSQKGQFKSRAEENVTSLVGQASAQLPRLGIHHQKILEGALVKESIPSGFSCFNCATEKTITIDLARRSLDWVCAECGRNFQEMLMNVKQKDITKMPEEDQHTLIDLIYVLVRLHEPTLPKEWRELLAKPDEWSHWLDRFTVGGA